MNSKEVEAATIEFVNRTSIMETISAQYWIFMGVNQRHPQLIQIDSRFQPIVWKELMAMTGASLDEVSSNMVMIENALLQFMNLPRDCYLRVYAPNCEPQTL